ncbi:MAG: hypothetical protein MUC42_05705, partial [Bryobacter sp.]|nr:hypothetical protein [Bryobacter sp.]
MTKRFLTICSVLGLFLGASSLLAQSDIGSVGKYELNLYGGASWWKQQAEAPRMKFVDGGTFGVRFTQNYWKYVGIEEAFNVHGVNNARFDIPGSNATTAFGHRIRGFTIAPVFHFTPRESRFRPFLLAGPGFNWYGPTSDAQNQASRPNGGGLGQPTNLQSELSPIFNYGGGIKMKMHKYVGLRFDARGTVSRTPSLGIPSFGPANVVTFSRRGPLNGAQVTGGLTFYMGKLAEPVMGEFRTGAIEASSLTACPGDKVTFRLPVTNTLTGVSTKYNWSLGGQSVGTGDSFTMTAPDKPGTYDIKVTAEPDTSAAKKDVLNYIKKNAITSKTLNQAVTVKEYRQPTVSASASPTSISVGQRATLTASGTGSECSGTLTYTWTSDCD